MNVPLVPMRYIPAGVKFGREPTHVLEDALDGFHQLAHNPLLMTAFCTTVVSVSFFDWSGMTLTKERIS